MKSFSFLFLTVFLSSSFLLANQLDVERTFLQRISGDNAYLPQYQDIELGEEIDGLKDGEKISSLILSSPTREADGNQLKLESKRSIVLMDESSLGELDESLADAITEVVDNKSELLNELNIEYSKPGIENFYVLGNFEAARTPGAESEWFVALIPKDVVVEKVILQTEWFGSGAGGHNQIRMILNQPVVGIPQSSHSHTPFVFAYDGDKGDITYALQAARVKGGEQDWAPLKGVMGEFGNALQFFDTRTLALDQITRSVVDDLVVLDVESVTGSTEKAKIRKQTSSVLVQAIVDSDSEQELSIYHTVFASCVTYALKALKAGIPEIKTTWFNPYSINVQVQNVLGSNWTLIRSSMNDTYGPYLESLGGDVMTWEKIRKTHPQMSNLVRNLKGPVLQNPAFDRIVQKVAVFIIQEGITYSQVKNFVEKAKQHGAVLADIPKSSEGQQLMLQIEELWKQAFPGRPVEDFFKALEGLQTQATN